MDQIDINPPWPETQPRFRRAVLTDRSAGMTFDDIGERVPASRQSVWRMMNVGSGITPSKPMQRAARIYADRVLGPFQGERSDGDPGE